MCVRADDLDTPSKPALAPHLCATQVGLIQSDMTPEARREAYLADVTYVTNSELGFDYLRDNLAGVSRRSQGCWVCCLSVHAPPVVALVGATVLS